jgi:hypothetical protein
MMSIYLVVEVAMRGVLQIGKSVCHCAGRLIDFSSCEKETLRFVSGRYNVCMKLETLMEL